MQLNACAVVCGSVLQMKNSGDVSMSASILFKYKCMVRPLSSEECCFGMMYVEWYGVIFFRYMFT